MKKRALFQTIVYGVVVLMMLTGAFGLEAEAGEKPVLYLFWGDGCGYCEKERQFLLEDFRERYPEVEMRFFESWRNPDGKALATAMRQALEIERASVPLTVIGEWHIVGFGGADSTGKKIEERIQLALKDGSQDALNLLGPQRIVAKVKDEIARSEPDGWERFPATDEEE